MTSGKFALPVVRQADAHQLLPHTVDIFIGPLGRMGPVLDRGVFRRHPEGIPAHRVQHIESLHPLETGDHVTDSIITDVAHVNPTRRIGEHLQQVVFLFS